MARAAQGKATQETKRAAINLALGAIASLNEDQIVQGNLTREQLNEALDQRRKVMERMPLDNLLQRLLIELPASAYHVA